jgi:phage shock protein C
MTVKKLTRSRKNRIIAGVCGGVGEYLDVDPTVIRFIWVVFSLIYGAGIIAYVVAWLIIPLEEPAGAPEAEAPEAGPSDEKNA